MSKAEATRIATERAKRSYNDFHVIQDEGGDYHAVSERALDEWLCFPDCKILKTVRAGLWY